MADDGARKRVKVDRLDTGPSTATIIDLSSDRGADATFGRHAPHQQEGEHFRTLQLLHGDFDALRQLITCKICERLLYEPFVLSCGHTYCYSCLSTWFYNNKKKTCPNCRDVVKAPPAPSYLIKEMTQVFIGRTELLPDGETLEQHAQWKKEEADIVNRDKHDTHPSTGGLFKGCFTGHLRLQPIHDPLDGVDRCPQCNWEVEDGMCAHCGFHFDDDDSQEDYSDSITDDDDDDVDDDEDEELDAELEAEDDDGFGIDADFGAFDAGFDVPHLVDAETGEIRFVDRLGHSDVSFGPDEDDEADEDDDEDSHSMQDFIDDGTLLEDNTAYTVSSESGRFPLDPLDGQPQAPQPSQSQPRRRNRRPVVLSSDDDDDDNDDDDNDDEIEDGTLAPRHISVSSDNEESDSGPEVASSRRRGGRGQYRQLMRSQPSVPIPTRGPVVHVVSDPSDSEDDQNSDDEENDDNNVDINGIQHSEDEDENENDLSDGFSDDASDSPCEDDDGAEHTHADIEDYGFSPMHSTDNYHGSGTDDEDEDASIQKHWG
ncbi:hypothetical protein MBLNU459_g5760t1 [Dothideomycetes sp. NU459]